MSLIPILGGAALTIASCGALGSVATRVIGFSGDSLSRPERAVLDFGVGAACLSTIIFTLCALQVAHTAIFVLLAALVLFTYFRQHDRLSLRGALSDLRAQIGERSLRVYGIILGFYGVVYFFYALAPSWGPDAVAYHLGLVRQYYNHHGFTLLTTNIYAFLPLGAEMLYLFAYSIGLHSAAELVHLSMAVATAVGIFAFTSRQATARAGLLAAVLYFCASVVGMDATTAYNDCALAFFCLLTFLTLFYWHNTPSMPNLILVGASAGFCFAVKYTGGVALAGAALVVLAVTLYSRRGMRSAVSSLFILGLSASVFMGPWLIKNVYVTGNPFAPLFNEWFPNPYVTVIWEDFFSETLRHYNGFGAEGWFDYLTAPLEITVWGGKATSIIGPAFLLFPVALLRRRSPLVRAAVFAAVLAALPWLANTGGRFLIPALPFAAIAIAVGLEGLPRRIVHGSGIAIAVLHAALAFPHVMTLWHPDWLWRLERPIPWKYALRLEEEFEYLRPRIPLYDIAARIEEVAGPNDVVLTLQQLPEAYMDTRVIVCYQGSQPEEMYRALRAPSDFSLWPVRRLRISLPEDTVGLTGFRIVLQNSHESVEWALSEITFLNNGTRIPRQADWRVNADPRPWDAGLVLDADPISTWYSGEPYRAGMSVKIAFPQAVDVTEAEVILPIAQESAQLEFQYQTASGDWVPIRAEPIVDQADLDEASMKRWAGQELMRRGVTLLLANARGEGHNFIASSIANDLPAWGFEEILRDGDWRLYRIVADAAQP